MDLQTLLALLIVLAAFAYMGRRVVRTVRAARPDSVSGGGCASGGCGCAPGSAPDRTLVADDEKGAAR